MRKRSYRRRFTPRARLPKQATMWIPAETSVQSSPQADPGVICDTGGGAKRFIDWSAITLRRNASGIENQSAASCKLLRIDGFIELYHNPLWDGEGSFVNEYDHTRIAYVWYKEKSSPAGFGGNAPFAASTAGAMSVRDEWMRRRDILKWGTVDVWGPNLNRDTFLPGWQGVTTVGAVAGGANAHIVANKRQGARKCVLPFPRLPKGGLNLLEGESLVCMTEAYCLTDERSYSAYREVESDCQVRLLIAT